MQADRDKWYGRFFEDFFESGPELVKVAVVGNHPFRKNADNITRVEGVFDVDKGLLFALRVFFCRGDRDAVAEFKEPAENRNFKNIMIHHESNRTLTGSCDDEPIDVTDMIGDEKYGPLFWDIRSPRVAEAIDCFCKDPEEKTHHKFG